MATHSIIFAWEIPWKRGAWWAIVHGVAKVQSVLKSNYSCCLVAQSCPTLHNSMDCNMPGLPVPHHLSEFAQVHVHCIDDAIQPSHPLSPPFSFAYIRVFSSESAVRIRWPKYCSFTFIKSAMCQAPFQCCTNGISCNISNGASM